MSNANPHLWPSARRRNALAGRLLAGALLLCGLGLGPEAASAGGPQEAGDAPRPVLAEDEVARLIREAAEKETDPAHRAALWEQYINYVETLWALAAESGHRPGEAGQKTERELREELARKLKQFDESMARVGDGDGGGLGKDGDGAGASAGDSAEDADAAGREVAARPASPSGDSAEPFETASALPAAVPPGSTGQPPEVASAGRPQGAGNAPRPGLVEDDVARLIREAAEKETDPVRQAALWEQYNSYVKNL